MQLNPGEQFAGQTVLLTGGLGFLGSVVLEQLLRLTEVNKVYLLVRSKKHLTAAQRVEKMLCCPLFSMLHDEARQGKRNVFKKVQAVEGDLSLPGLGLSGSDATAVQQECSVVIHCAADIELDAHIQKTIKANYIGTQNLLQLANSMPSLRAFVHTSTYFVNNWQPRNSLVKEEIHKLPLTLASKGSTSISHSEFVDAVLTMDADVAETEVQAVMDELNFNSNYAFGKYLTELLVEDAAFAPSVGRCIVRPSLIAPVAGAPYPGYVAGYGGPSGYTMGYAVGFFHSIASVAFGSDYVMDLIPCDTVAAVCITAAAAGIQASSSSQRPQKLAIYHAASAFSHPCPLTLVFDIAGRFWEANPPPLRLPFTRYPNFTCERLAPNPISMAVDKWITQAKIYAIGWALWAAGKSREADLLSNAFRAFNVYNSRRYDRSIISAVDNVRALQARVPASEQTAWPMVWEPCIMGWWQYGYLTCSGIRHILFKVQAENKTDLPIKYQPKKAADSSMLQKWLSVPAAAAVAAAPPSSNVSSSVAVDAAKSGGRKSSEHHVRRHAGKVFEVDATAAMPVEAVH